MVHLTEDNSIDNHPKYYSLRYKNTSYHKHFMKIQRHSENTEEYVRGDYL